MIIKIVTTLLLSSTWWFYSFAIWVSWDVGHEKEVLNWRYPTLFQVVCEGNIAQNYGFGPLRCGKPHWGQGHLEFMIHIPVGSM